MAVFTDLASNLDSALDSEADLATYLAALQTAQAAQPALPAAFDDQAAYDTYVSAMATWTASVASAQTTYDLVAAALAEDEAVLLANIPLFDVKFKITGETSYYVSKHRNDWVDVELTIEVTT